MLDIAEFDYNLPREAIAQTPTEPRDQARLLVDKGPTATPEHRHVSDLVDLLLPGDLLVANNTKVIPARLNLHKPSGAKAEVLLLEPSTSSDSQSRGWWSALVKPGRRLRKGMELTSDLDPSLRVEIGDRIINPATGAGDGQRAVCVRHGDELVETPDDAVRLLALAGEAPLPPYINVPDSKTISTAQHHQLLRLQRYQTVYAAQPGSVAAPTAGLHFTPSLLEALASKGVGWATIDLVVGLDTFRPVTGSLLDHVMHTERFAVPQNTWQQCQAAKRVIAVGTTSVRALESAARAKFEGRTDLFLKRGEQFQVVDLLMTNFHLPRSTLLLLVDAFIGSHWRRLYETALANDYRFLSFGDAMLLKRQQR